MLYSSYPLVAPVYEGRGNVTEAVPAEHGLPMYSLTFSDKETTAMFYYNGVDAYYGKGCEILLLVNWPFSHCFSSEQPEDHPLYPPAQRGDPGHGGRRP